MFGFFRGIAAPRLLLRLTQRSMNMEKSALSSLTDTVQRNCHISDARHGTDYTLCTYLMKMREYFRWEKGLPFSASLSRDAIGDWLVERESLWESLDEADFEPLLIEGRSYDPFAAEDINQALRHIGLVYSSGLGRNAKPHFFLGGLEKHQQSEGYSLFVANEEYARDLSAPPAMTSGKTVYIRRESLRRMLWEKLEGWRWNRPDNALGRALACYDFESGLEASLDAMTETELQAVLLHEIGEYQAGRLLGDTWNEMLLALCNSPAELMARAVRDHLADCMNTLPELVRQGCAASIHFYLGNLNHMRKTIFPGLGGAYEEWLNSGDLEALGAIAEVGREHWATQAARMMETYHRFGADASDRIQKLVEDNYL